MSNVLYWLADETACGHYRCLLPGKALSAKGHRVVASTVLQLAELDQAGVFVGQRIAKDGPSNVWQSYARQPDRARMVLELDDDVFALRHEEHNPNRVDWIRYAPNLARNLACADVVTVSTPTLADVVSQHTTADVHVVPNAIPQSLLASALPARSKPSVLGWSGSATHDGDWLYRDNARAVMRWLAQHPTWGLTTIGRPPNPLMDAHQTHDKAYWSTFDGTPDIERYYAMVRTTFDVGLAPLADTAFNRAKSDLRLLELAALGIPWVASNVGPYATGPFGGVHITRQRDWWHELDLLTRDADVRGLLRVEGRTWARSRTIDRVLPLWEKAFGL